MTSPGSPFWRRTTLAGGFLVGVAGCFAGSALTLDLGTLRNMGPGFFPLLASGLLALLGLATIFLDRTDRDDAPEGLNLRGILLLGAAPLMFLLVVEPFGLAPATFGATLVSCLAPRGVGLRSAFVTALLVTALGMGVFSGLLGVSDPLFRFGG